MSSLPGWRGARLSKVRSARCSEQRIHVLGGATSSCTGSPRMKKKAGVGMRTRTALSAVLTTSLAALTLVALAAPAGATKPEPTPSEPVAESPLRLGGEISTDSPEYARLASSPDFHYAPATPANLRRVAATPPLDAGLAVVAPLVWAGNCEFTGKGGNPHISTKWGGRQASVHGYWVKISGTCPSTAKVTVDLQALACSSLYGCMWVTQNTDSGTYTPGSGSGKWATPHKPCANANRVGWRGRVDVDLTNVNDPSGYQYSPELDLDCSPA